MTEKQQSLFDPIVQDESVQPEKSRLVTWDSSLTHRMRVLLHTSPLHDLRLSDQRRDPDFRHYDSLALAIAVLDLVIDTMGLDREADRAAVLRALVPLLKEMDDAAGVAHDHQRHADMTDRVLAGLRNDGNGRRPFDLDYQDFDADGKAVRRVLEFRLVADHFHPAGGVVLRLSNEAVNLYLNALELDIEDAQAATEAVVHSQLARGKFNEAVQSARNARLQSIRYQDKLISILRDTRRDVGRVDWRYDVPRLLSEALEHIKSRLDTESTIISTAEQRLDVLAAGDDRARKVAEVVRLIRDCRLRHVDLHDQLMHARNVFLDEQARQGFLPAPLTPVPELMTEVLEPVLRLGRSLALEALDQVFPTFFGARAAPALSLAETVLWQLRPRREAPSNEVPLEATDLSSYGADVLRYSREVRNQAETMLAQIDAPITLSSLLEDAKAAAPAQTELPELLALLILHHYAPDQEEAAILRVEKSLGKSLCVTGFDGDEMDISRWGQDAV